VANTISEALSGPSSAFFWLDIRNYNLTSGNSESFFRKLDDRFTFDISNSKVAVNVCYNGAIRNWTVYRGCYQVDDIPGVWWHKDYSTIGPLSFRIKLDGVVTDLAEVRSELRTGLLGNVIPRTEIDLGPLRLTLVSFAPISRCGTSRAPASIYGLLAQNRSSHSVSGEINLPMPCAAEWRGEMGSSGVESFQVGIGLADGLEQRDKIPFILAPGEELWTPVVICSIPAADALTQIESRSSLEWLTETLAYYRSVTGQLEMAKDPFLAEYFERCVHQCLHAFSMASDGTLTGSNWGSFPITNRIWMKDMYYSALPLALFEPELAKRTIDWFLDRSVRPARIGPPRFFKGAQINSGISHSLSNSLTPILLAVIYYHTTGDGEFFIKPHRRSRLLEIMEQARHSKKEEIDLFPSDWISDGRSLGDYHTGSNLVAWFAFRGLARILREVYRNDDTARAYDEIAARLQAALDQHCMTTGQTGRIFVEGSFADGRVLEGHDGEESDITLMPFYGYRSFDDDDYKRSMRHAVSQANPWYVPETRGLKWSENPGDPNSPTWTDATFPGYTTRIGSISDVDGMSGPEGAMTQIRRLTDLDGSNWWWPYPAEGKYGVVTREFTGKSGWAAGVFISLFVTQILGLDYDARERSLRVRPFSPSGDFVWRQARFGNALFDIGFWRDKGMTKLSISNLNGFTVKIDWELPAPEGKIEVSENLNSVAYREATFMGQRTVKNLSRSLGGGTVEVIVRNG